jgi:uncharacterized membrane protein
MVRLALSAVALAAYGGLAHWLMLHAAASPWAVLLLLGPLLLSFAAWALSQRRWGVLALAVLGMLAAWWAGGAADVNRLYVLQHAGIHAALAAVFAMSLRVGGVPLITRVALRVHGGRMPPAKHAYNRHVTVAWAAYFVLMGVASLALYAWAPWAWWSLFANLLTPLSLGLMMAGEWRLRYWLHPEFERVPIATAVRAFRDTPAASA